MAELNEKMHQELCIKDRCRLTLDGVMNVEEFSEVFLMLKTNVGILCVEGENLKIESLEKGNGSILVTGTVNGLFYKTHSEGRGWFSRLFK